MKPLNIRNFLWIILFCSIGCISCLYLQTYQLLPSFLSSALVGLIGSLLPKSTFYNHKEGVACIYAGSFAGMCSVTFFTNLAEVLLLCTLVGLSYILISPYFKGIGGKLGTIGFIGSITYLGLRGLLWL